VRRERFFFVIMELPPAGRHAVGNSGRNRSARHTRRVTCGDLARIFFEREEVTDGFIEAAVARWLAARPEPD
jgi:hypothetical protein